jgi:hypothetical protein
MRGSKNNFPIEIRIPDSRRMDLERAAPMHGQSVLSFVEPLVGRVLADAGLLNSLQNQKSYGGQPAISKVERK